MKRIEIGAILERQIHQWNLGEGRPTVKSVATEAGLSTQAIYSSHKDIVEKIRVLKHASIFDTSVSTKIQMLRERVASERLRSSMLATLCGELAAEISEVREELAITKARLRRAEKILGKNPST